MLVWAGCAAGSGPELEPIGAQSVVVNETLVVVLAVRGGEGHAFRFEVRAPRVPAIEGTMEVTGDGLLRWTPLAVHVGRHRVEVLLLDAEGTLLDVESVEIEVLPEAGTAPVFVRPGAGQVWDVGAMPCLGFDVEVRDDDSDEVAIRARAELWDGATLVQESARQSAFAWCPSPMQIAAVQRWTLSLEADDGAHRTELDHVILLERSP
jgi:hypothetical protein